MEDLFHCHLLKLSSLDNCHNHRTCNGSDDQAVRGAAGVSGMEWRQFLRLYGAFMILVHPIWWLVNEPLSRLRGLLNVWSW